MIPKVYIARRKVTDAWGNTRSVYKVFSTDIERELYIKEYIKKNDYTTHLFERLDLNLYQVLEYILNLIASKADRL